MKNGDVLRIELLALLRHGNSHMTFEEVVENFPVDRINRNAPNMPYSPWHILEHMRIAQRDILLFIKDPEYESPDWPSGYFLSPKDKTNEIGWRKTIENFLADRAVLENIVKDQETNLFAPIPHAKNYNIFREILVVADHNAYHIGELAMMRQVMEAWPPAVVLYDAE